MSIIHAVRRSFRDGYVAYLEKVDTFEDPPEIGEQWPRDGYFIPTTEVFLAEFAQRASANTINLILDATPVESEEQAQNLLRVVDTQLALSSR